MSTAKPRYLICIIGESNCYESSHNDVPLCIWQVIGFTEKADTYHAWDRYCDIFKSDKCKSSLEKVYGLNSIDCYALVRIDECQTVSLIELLTSFAQFDEAGCLILPRPDYLLALVGGHAWNKSQLTEVTECKVSTYKMTMSKAESSSHLSGRIRQ